VKLNIISNFIIRKVQKPQKFALVYGTPTLPRNYAKYATLGIHINDTYNVDDT
jgi:hypothetical protein